MADKVFVSGDVVFKTEIKDVDAILAQDDDEYFVIMRASKEDLKKNLFKLLWTLWKMIKIQI
ncbi:MAG: hypothetical protein D4S01_05700 [Dehalococcoidia bacterium]|nr:MAG: hypothetical protein D4S01_05700 [Dehalococcoidia bacterium]